MKHILMIVVALTFVVSSTLFASNNDPTRKQLVGNYAQQDMYNDSRLELTAAGTFHETYHMHMADGDEVTTGTWHLRKGWVVMKRTKGAKIGFRRFYVMPDGTTWALLPGIFFEPKRRGHLQAYLRWAYRRKTPATSPPA